MKPPAPPQTVRDLRQRLANSAPSPVPTATLTIDPDPNWRGAGMTIHHAWHPSPAGQVHLASDAHGLLVGLSFKPPIAPDDLRTWAEERLRRLWPNATLIASASATTELGRRVFNPPDDRRYRIDPTLRLLVRGTPFQVAVWRALATIPLGGVVSYGQIAARAGHPTAIRAAASAVGSNPISFALPCHCVIRANGALGRYHWGVEQKRRLLAWEATRSIPPRDADL